MDKLGLSPADFGTYLRGLTTPGHKRVIHMHVLDLSDGSHLTSLTPKHLDGQVTFDTTAEVSRVLTCSVADPKNALGFDPHDPSEAPLHYSRELRVIDSRYIDELDDWVDDPVFTGAIFNFNRDGGQVDLTAHGRERRGLAPAAVNSAHHFPKKSKITDAIRWLLASMGDVNAHVPDLAHTLPHDLTIHPLDQAWPHVKHLAASLDQYVFYDGAGRFQMRPHSQRPVFNFHRAILGNVAVARTVDGFFNTYLVLGPKPHAPKKRVSGTATLGDPPPAPVKAGQASRKRVTGTAVIDGTLSPADLSRNGVGLHLVSKVERQHLKTNAQAQKIANRLLREHATTRTDLTFDSMPVPPLEEHDMVSVTDDSFGTARLRMRQWVLPLSGGDAMASDGAPMSVGTVKRTTKARLRK